MKTTLYVVVALGLGVLIGARFRAQEGNCCKRLAKAVRDKVADDLDPRVAQVGDLFNLWGLAPGLLDVGGIET